MSTALLFTLALGCVGDLLAQTWTADNGNGTYSNPLFGDEFADPDVIRVGADYYLTGSSMHAMPGLAILHSRDLVNWNFESFAEDKLDLGPAYRLQDGKNVYGQGIWAPALRYAQGKFYVFANVNGQTTQIYSASSPRGPWAHTAMKRSFHDLSVLFDDDGKAWVVWGYADIHIAQLTANLLDVVPGTERLLIAKSQGMGEGLHIYRIRGRYYITSAWYSGVMRLVVARADSLTGPWEVNRDISVGEQFGQVLGWRLDAFRPPLTTTKPYKIEPPAPSAIGRMAIHQGGIVDTPAGEWWGLSMGEANAIGRTTTLSPITWTDGWPYFGLPGNLGRSPRTWMKPDTGASETPHSPYKRSDDFSATHLQPVWQWNHVPADDHWSLTDRPGFLRLHAMPATSLWDARNSLTQRAIGPRSIVTAVLETTGMETGDQAGLALLIQPEASIGVEKEGSRSVIVQHDGQFERNQRVPLSVTKVWLRIDCDYDTQLAHFRYSTDGTNFLPLGEPFRMVTIGVTFQGVRYALYSYRTASGASGYADFDRVDVSEPSPHATTRPIPYGRQIDLADHDDGRALVVAEGAVLAARGKATSFRVVDREHGRVALEAPGGFLSVDQSGRISLREEAPGSTETFQWIETFAGDLTLMSLTNHRYLHVDSTGAVRADSPGPEPNGPPGVRLEWNDAAHTSPM